MIRSIKIAIFASGKGSNAESIIDYFQENEYINIGLIITNNPKAGVIKLAERKGITSMVIDRDYFYKSEKILQLLEFNKIDFIALAGFLWMIPEYFIQAFHDKIVNIHPSLLPKYGGKGMYGQHVHRAVYDNSEIESGITIHMVNENYDQGKIVFQASCEIDSEDSPDEIAEKVLALEHFHYPRVIEEILTSQRRNV